MKVDLRKVRELILKKAATPEERKIIEKEFNEREILESQNILHVDITFDDSNTYQTLQMNQEMSQPTQFGHQESGIDFMGNYFPTMPTGHTPIFAANKTHLGIESCYLVQSYIHNYPNLKETAILLKKFLALHDFNSPYYGGLSSYSAVLLIVAYLNYHKREQVETLSPSQVLMGFLDFYGNYFNPSQWGINVVGNG